LPNSPINRDFFYSRFHRPIIQNPVNSPLFYAENTSRSGKRYLQKDTKKISPEGCREIDYRRLTVMQYQNSKTRFSRALTLVEMVIAMAIMAIVFAVILPQFRVIQNSWDSKQAAAETLQNSRVLMDHLYRNFSKAVKITAVSDSSETNGYIEFEDNIGDTLRYDVDANNYVEFGPVGDLYDLAGPVSQLQFTCYDGNDFDTAITDVNDIRFIKLQTTLTNPAAMGHDKTFTAQIYLRTNVNSGDGGLVGWWKLDETSGKDAEDSSGNGNDGRLKNMAGDEWTTGAVAGALEFDGNNDYVDCGNDASLNITGAVTVTAWIKLTAAGIDQKVAGNQDGSAGGYKMTVFSNNKVEFEIRDSGNNAVLNRDEPGGTVLTTGVWYHVAGVYSQGNYIRTYVDGNLDRPMSTASVLGSTSGTLKLGCEPFSPLYFFNGLLDDVRIYNCALSAEEIAQLANILRYKEFTEAKAGSDVTSITISTPSGTSEDDFLIVAVATDGDTSGSMAPPPGEGWTQISLNDYNNEVTLGVWWKLADVSESASHQFTWSGVRQAYGWMMRFMGHDPNNPIDIWAANGEADTNPTCPSVTTDVNDCLILRIGAFDDDDITMDDPGLSGHTHITMDASASSAGQVTYQEFTEAKASDNVTSISISTPGGTSEGDLLIAAVTTDGNVEGTLAPPGGEGWTEIDISRQTNAVTLGVWWKLADASESPSHQFTWSGGQEAYAWMMRFTGHDASTPINVSAVNGGNSNPPTSPSVTTTVANTMIVRFGGFDDDDVNVDSPGLSGHTPITMDESGTGFGTCSGGAGYIQQPAIGSSGTSTFSLTGPEQYRTVTIAIAPEPVTGGGMVSGGAGYVKQATSGASGISSFSLTASQESRVVTLAIVPDPAGGGGGAGGGGIYP